MTDAEYENDTPREVWEPIGVIPRNAGGGPMRHDVDEVWVIETAEFSSELRKRRVAIEDIPEAGGS